MDFKDKLRKLRIDNGLSQEALADAVHISRSAIAKYENGNGNPSEDTLRALATYFDVDVSELKSDEKIIKDRRKKIITKVGLVSLAVVVVGGTITGVTLGIVQSVNKNSSPYPPDSSPYPPDPTFSTANISLTHYYDNGVAKLYYEGQILGEAFEKVVEPANLVAGDVFHFQYTGKLADPIYSIPGELDILGYLEKYNYIDTRIVEYTFESASELDNMYNITDRYVVINKSGKYVSLDDYSGGKIYLTYNYKAMYMDTEGHFDHDVEKVIISAIYSFNPRLSG